MSNTTPEIDRLALNATGGTFTLTVNGQTTAALPFGIGAGALQSAIQGLAGIGANNAAVVQNSDGTFTITYAKSLGPITSSTNGSLLKGLQFALESLSTIGAGNVQVVQANNVYRITFGGTLAGQAVPLIQAHDFGLTNGSGHTNIVNINDQGFTKPDVAVLTPTTLTLNSTSAAQAMLGGKPTPNDVVSLIFTTGPTTSEEVDYTVQATDTMIANVATGLLNALKNDAVLTAAGYSFALNGTTISITPAASGPIYAWQSQVTGAGTETITNPNADWYEANAIQEIHIDATGGTFTLSFNGKTTAPLAWNAPATTTGGCAGRAECPAGADFDRPEQRGRDQERRRLHAAFPGHADQLCSAAGDGGEQFAGEGL